MDNTRLYWLHTLSPTHVGTGRGVGYIDLPVHRDKVTNWPLIPGSAFKGVWADHYGATDTARRDNRKLGLAFGRASDTDSSASNAGALVPTDARLVCLPIRSVFGTFAWCTSPLALEMLRRDLELAKPKELPPAPPEVADERVHLASRTVLGDTKDGRVYLEDLDFSGTDDPTTTAWAKTLAEWIFPDAANPGWQERFIARLAVVSDDVFSFLCETGTEVVARVRIDAELKTVANQALWNEESLPAETILAGLVTCDRIYAREPNGITAAELIRNYASQELLLQIGGKATVGRGRVRCVFSPVE